MNIPVLVLTYNRLEYTKKALEALYYSDCGNIYIIDNGSTDGTQEWLINTTRAELYINKENKGIAYSMNQFLAITKDYEFVSKVDNDTLVPANWCSILTDKLIKHNIDLIQAKHPIIKATHPDGWDGFIKTCKQDKIDKSIYYNTFIGGSGIVFRRDKVNEIPETEWALGGWREFQRQHPELKKAFCTDVEIQLLDEHGYEDYPEYYKQTKRIL